jgi:Sec-independent protein translocase protein TatA
MPGLGFSELLVLAALILLFFREEDLPKIMRLIGRLYARGYRYILLFRQEMRKLEKSIGIEEEMKEIRAINGRLNSEIATFKKEIREEMDTEKEDDKDPEKAKEPEKVPEKEE